MSERDEEEKEDRKSKALVRYQKDLTDGTRQLRMELKCRDRLREIRREEKKRRRQLKDFSEVVGWSEDKLIEIADKLSNMSAMLKGHHHGELLAIAKDLAHGIDIKLANQYQAAAIICIFLGMDDDEDDEDELEPEPKNEDELTLA